MHYLNDLKEIMSVGRRFSYDCKIVIPIRAKFCEKELEKIDFAKTVACSRINLEFQNTIHFSR